MKPALTSLVGLLLVGVVLPASAQEILVDFRRDKVEQSEFNWDGAKAEEFIKPEAEGLRWRFTVGRAPKKAVGVSWKTRLDGDFTVTAQYEILRADKPAQGIGVGRGNVPDPRHAGAAKRRPRLRRASCTSRWRNDLQSHPDDQRRKRKNRVGKVLARQIAGAAQRQGPAVLCRATARDVHRLGCGSGRRSTNLKEIARRRDIKRYASLQSRVSPAWKGAVLRPELDMRLLEFHLTEKNCLLLPRPSRTRMLAGQAETQGCWPGRRPPRTQANQPVDCHRPGRRRSAGAVGRDRPGGRQPQEGQDAGASRAEKEKLEKGET